jgi:hypothetical protein
MAMVGGSMRNVKRLAKLLPVAEFWRAFFCKLIAGFAKVGRMERNWDLLSHADCLANYHRWPTAVRRAPF